jgi:hypothetical protein
LTVVRSRRDRELETVLETALVGLDGDDTKPETARVVANALVQLNPVHERARRVLMNPYIREDERAAALRLFDSLSERLLTEMSVQPAVKTVRLADKIRHSEPPMGNAVTNGVAGVVGGADADDLGLAARRAPYPVPTDQAIGDRGAVDTEIPLFVGPFVASGEMDAVAPFAEALEMEVLARLVGLG